MNPARELQKKYRNKFFYKKEKDKNGGQSPNESSSETGILREDHFQNHFNYYLNLNREEVVSRKKIFMTPHQFKYLAKVLFKISQSDDEKILYKWVIIFFMKMKMNSEQLFSPHFPPSLLNNIEQFEQRLHNCELLSKNHHFIKHLPLAYDTQLRSDEIPFHLIEKSELVKDFGDKENKLKGMICGLANHRGGYIITCQSFARNRINSGLKEITKALIENIKFKLEVVLDTIVRKQDIGIEVNSIPLKYPDGKEEVEKEYVILIQVKINPERSSCVFYIDRKKYKELYKQQLYAYEQQLKSKYNKVIDAMRKESPKKQVQKFSKQKLDNKNVSLIKRLFYEEYQNQWISKEEKKYQEIRKIMKFNMKRETLEDFKWKQNFIAGITFNIKQMIIEQMEDIKLPLSKNGDNHLRQICNYLMSRKQSSKKEIEQFFPEIPNEYSVGLIIHGQNIKKDEINKILQGILKMSKTPYKIIVPFEELQIQIGKQRSNNSKTSTDTKIVQNYHYYVIFKGYYQTLYVPFKKQLGKKNLVVTMNPVKVKSQVGSFLTNEDLIILNKTIYGFFNVVPDVSKVLNGKYEPEKQFQQQQIKYCQAFFEGNFWIEQPYKYKQVKISFKGNELNASVFCYFLLQLAKKRPKPSVQI